VSAPAQEVEAIVRDELREPVAEIVERVVRELVGEQLNGYGRPAVVPLRLRHAPPVAPNESAAVTDTPPPSTGLTTGLAAKVCTICGQAEPVARFDQGRRQCKACRRRRYPRQRAAASDGEEQGIAAA
jgi:hypothetical protein